MPCIIISENSFSVKILQVNTVVFIITEIICYVTEAQYQRAKI